MLNKIQYCINKTQNNIKELENKKILLDLKLNEINLFGGNLNPINCQLMKIENQLTLNNIILNELNNIKFTKNISNDDLNSFVSPYGSLYFGTDTFYYNDSINEYSQDQFYQIILNHIGHYLLGYISANSTELTQKSNLLLLFDNINSFFPDKNIIYAQSKRNSLYNNKTYNEIIKNNIIFPINKKLKKYIMDNNINNNYLKFENDSDGIGQLTSYN